MCPVQGHWQLCRVVIDFYLFFRVSSLSKVAEKGGINISDKIQMSIFPEKSGNLICPVTKFTIHSFFNSTCSGTLSYI